MRKPLWLDESYRICFFERKKKYQSPEILYFFFVFLNNKCKEIKPKKSHQGFLEKELPTRVKRIKIQIARSLIEIVTSLHNIFKQSISLALKVCTRPNRVNLVTL